MSSLFQSSGDLIADRRYGIAREFLARGDASAAADVLAQTVERAPRFAAAWFALGEAHEALGRRNDAISAFQNARAADPQDRHGATLRLIRLGAEAIGDMPADYVRDVFDQYAARFDDALVRGLAYRGPELLLAAVQRACAARGRPATFNATIDLGCGTGLGGAAFRPFTATLIGIDLSANMVTLARGKGLYDRLKVGDIVAFVASEPAASVDLLLAADVFAYLADLSSVIAASARVLIPGGLLAFTVETHAGEGIVLGDKLRYAHGVAHVHAALAASRLTLVSLETASTRNEAGVPVPGLVVVAERARRR
jgi:predicted TPR repeat methyltransferase